jgi:hypothetical protein
VGAFGCVSGGCHNTVIGGVIHGTEASCYTTTIGGLYSCHEFSFWNVSGAAEHHYISGYTCDSGIGSAYYSGLSGSCSSFLFENTGNFYSGYNCTTKFNNLYKNTNFFFIGHPDPDKFDKMLMHSNVEAPTEGDTLYRYNVNTCNGQAEINLPDYFKHLNKCPQVWVTPNNSFGNAYGEIDASLSRLTICSDADGSYSALILGTRKDEYAIKGWCGAEVNKPLSYREF